MTDQEQKYAREQILQMTSNKCYALYKAAGLDYASIRNLQAVIDEPVKVEATRVENLIMLENADAAQAVKDFEQFLSKIQ